MSRAVSQCSPEHSTAQLYPTAPLSTCCTAAINTSAPCRELGELGEHVYCTVLYCTVLGEHVYCQFQCALCTSLYTSHCVVQHSKGLFMNYDTHFCVGSRPSPPYNKVVPAFLRMIFNFFFCHFYITFY